MADERAKQALSERVALAGLGAPKIVETKLVRLAYLAREGRLLTILRKDGVRSEQVAEGLFCVALGSDTELPVEVLDPRLLQPAAEPESALPELSLDGFDQIVRRKTEAKLHAGAQLADLDLHPTWGPRVHLVHVPFVSLTFTVQPDLGLFRALAKHPTGRYRSLVSLHDGAVKHVELPKIRSRALGWLAGFGLLGVVLFLLALVLFVVVLAVYLA